MKNSVGDKLIPLVTKFTNLKFIKAMQKGVTAGFGATVAGSIFMLLMTPPFTANMTGGFVEAWRSFSANNAEWLNLAYQMTMGMVSLFTLFGVTFAACEEEKMRPVNALVVSFIFFGIVSSNIVEGAFDLGFFGAKGLMCAIVVGFIVPELIHFLEEHGFKIKLPDTVPPFVAEPISAMIVDIIIIGLACGVRLVCGQVLLPALINKLFSPLFIAGDSFVAIFVYCLVVRLLWFCGIHGGNVAGAIINPIITMNMVENADAYIAGEPLPHIFTSGFNSWTVMGMLAICVAIMISCKSQQLKAVSKIAIAPALFNIGEPITFGLPIVMNFAILIPYLLIFVIDGCVPYFLTEIGFLGRSYIGVPYTLPAIVKVFLTSMDYKAIIVYIILFIINVAIMIPWLKKYDKQLIEKEAAGE